MADLSQQFVTGFNDVFGSVKKLSVTREQKAEVVNVGAEVLSEELISVTKDTVEGNGKHLNNELGILMDFKAQSKGRYEYPNVRLWDGVTFKKNQYFDGSTDVGFDKRLVTVAHWFNNGTYQQPATFFMNRAFQSGQDAVRKAQFEKGHELFNEISKGIKL